MFPYGGCTIEQFITLRSGLPMRHCLLTFDALEVEPKFTPFKFVLYVELTLQIG